MEHYEEQWSRPRSFCHARSSYSGPGSYTSFDFWGEWLGMLWQGTPSHLNQPYVDSLRQVAPYAGVWLLLCVALWVWKRNQAARAAEAPKASVGAAVGASEIDQLNAQLRAQVVQSIPGSAFRASSVQAFVAVMIDVDAHRCCRQWQRE